MLIRPLGSMFQILAREVSIRRVGKLAQAGAVLAWSISRLELEWTAAKLGLTLLTILSATVIFAGIWITGITIAFWWVDTAEIVNTATYGGSYLAQHPMSIFSRWMRRFAIFLVPVAFVSYFPALAILGKTDPLRYPAWASFAGVPVAMVLLFVARWQWSNAVRHYRSTGS